MKLMPASRALAMIRAEVASSVGPPNIMVPRQIGEIFRPLWPRLRYCIGGGSSEFRSSFRDGPKDQTRNLEIPGSMLAHRPGMTARAEAPSIVLQYLKHTAGHRDTAPVDGDLGGDEDQAAGRAHHARLRHQNLADLAGLDEMEIGG